MYLVLQKLDAPGQGDTSAGVGTAPLRGEIKEGLWGTAGEGAMFGM